MMFSRTTINDKLSLPLIISSGEAASNHHQQPERQEEQHDRRPTIEPVQGKQQQQHDPVVKDVVEEHPLVGAILSCIWCLLLLVQFTISFPSSVIAAPFNASGSTADAITATIQSSSSSSSFSIYASVLIFFGASLLYRRTIQEVEHDEVNNSNNATKVPAVLHLVPELVTVMTIGSCYGGHAMAGLVIMVTGAFVMASAVVAYCTVALWSSTRNNNKKNEAASTATTCCCPAEQTLARDDVADDAVVRPV
jgi:hypothetical protein